MHGGLSLEVFVERHVAMARPVDELVQDDEIASPDILATTACGSLRQDMRAPSGLKSMDIGAVVDLAGWDGVRPSVARQQDHVDVFDRAVFQE